MRYRLITIAVVLCGLLSSGSITHAQDTRTFYMGFTPFPYDISFEAVDFVYETLAEDADITLHSFDEGIPWAEALDDQPYGDSIMNEWNTRRERTPAHHQVYVAVTPINFARNALAPYWGVERDMPLSAPWDAYSFDHPDVKAAYLKFCEQVIAFFEPDVLSIGIEVNLLMINQPDLWDSYVQLHRETYNALKEKYPDLVLLATMTGIDLLEGYTDADPDAQIEAFEDIIPYTDYFALSIYPYMTRYMTNSIPKDMFDRLAEMTDKPMAIGETGYPAQPFTVEEGGVRLAFKSDMAKQNTYIDLLLSEAEEHEFKFVINFVLRDYDALWEDIGSPTGAAIVWRDTGLYDEEGTPRPALETWRAVLERPVKD